MPGRRENRCCQCNGPNKKCTNCQCTRANRACRNCLKGVQCQNPRGNNQSRETEEERPDDSGETPEEGQEQERETSPQDNNDRDITWKNLSKDDALRWLDNTYSEIVGWSTGNFFEPPKCEATANAIKEMVVLLNNCNQDSPLAALALKVFFILPKLLFQKIHTKARVRENVKAVTRRVNL